MSALIYRKAFHDPTSLRQMMRGEVPRIEDIQRRIFVSERQSEPGWPDHFVKNHLLHRLGNVRHTHVLATHVLNDLADRFIIRLNGRLRIRSEQFLEWQELLPSISPLNVVVAFLVKECQGPNFGLDPRRYLASELGSTALLAPFQPTIEAMIERDGLNEMHMHLNGSTEADLIWAEAVRDPVRFCRDLSEELRGKTGGAVKELYDQIEIDLRPPEFRHRLMAVRCVRHLVADTLRRLRSGLKLDISKSTLFNFLRYPLEVSDLPLSKVPAQVIFGSGNFEPLIDEAALLYAWQQALAAPTAPSEVLGLGLYFQSLVHGQVVALSVHQQEQSGFDQFQKITLVGVRSQVEKKYEKRFRQLNRRPPYRTLTHLEGRFAPKDKFGDLITLIENIVKGYLAFRDCRDKSVANLYRDLPGCVRGRCDCVSKVGRKDAELSLVAHFIKAEDDATPRGQVLHGKLRYKLMRQARILAQALRLRGVRDVVRGIDAASNELHAPPEVFGPSFRLLRAKGLDRTTYHAGEDFVHLASGIRATDEALTFLPLQEGDRLGHATALGIEPALWAERIGSQMVIGSAEHLDNMVYAHSRLAGTLHSGEAMRWQEDIARLAQKIYGREVEAATLKLAWKMRHLDMLVILDLERREGLVPGDKAIADIARRVMRITVGRARHEELRLIAEEVEAHPTAYQIARQRHQLPRRWTKEREQIDTGWISHAALCTLQNDILKRLAERRVAIETLPTSNVRISFYRHYKEHHIFRWLGVSGEGFAVMPDVCVGSDDTGIFATNLHNEYALLFETLCRNFGKTPREATKDLEDLNRSGFAHRFVNLGNSIV